MVMGDLRGGHTQPAEYDSLDQSLSHHRHQQHSRCWCTPYQTQQSGMVFRYKKRHHCLEFIFTKTNSVCKKKMKDYKFERFFPITGYG